ncbi:hypothetical protein [Acinetobacter sp. ANC 3791]|nr:hypothetical protein [Acinetobacter sp. ANC 3791]
MLEATLFIGIIAASTRGLENCLRWLIYAGLGKIKSHRLFAVTNVLILC